VRNRAPRARGGVVELELEATIADVAVGPGSATRQGTRRRVSPWQMAGATLQIIERSERIALTESARNYPDADLVATTRALAWIRPVAGYSVESFAQTAVGDSATSQPSNPVVTTDRTLDNGLLRVELSDEGSVRVIDKRNGRMVENAVTLENTADAGDLYTPAIRESLASPGVRRVRLVHRGPIRGELAIDYVRRTPKAASVECRLSIALDADAPFVRIGVHGRNDARDHRLRLRVATGLASATSIADAAFLPVQRDPVSISDADARMEHVVPTAPLHRYVSRYGSGAGATLFSDGLAEYESLADGSIAVTLLRAVGALSRHDLPERPGHAGWPAHTPLAQSLGAYSARFALALHGADSDAQRARVESMADDVLLPLVGETLRSNLEDPRVSGGLALDGEGLAFSGAMPAREAGWIVLRCVNHRSVEVHGEWRLSRELSEAHRARLDETPLAALEVSRGVIRFVAAPREIVTIVAKPVS